ncbi:MAG: methyl-accepting chemotaxis protein [candidate division WOR-3 bacterium]
MKDVKKITTIKDLSRAIKEIVEGKIEVNRHFEVVGKGEIKDLAESLNLFLKKINEVIYEFKIDLPKFSEMSESLAATSQELSSSSEEISSTIQQISQGSGLQLESLNKSVDVARQTSLLTAQTNEAAANSEKISSTILELSKAGKAESEAAITNIDKIVRGVDTLREKVEVVNQHARKISKITETLDSIASRTNLLALNAAIEAARVGVEGRGFAVVADEVTKLAERSRKESAEIGSIVKEITKSVSEMVQATQTTSAEISNSRWVLLDAATRLKEISEKITESVTGIKKIFELSKKEKESINELVQILDGVARTATENASRAQEVAAAVEQETASIAQLSEMTQNLSAIAGKIKGILERFETT